jgi:hypothetical protein
MDGGFMKCYEALLNDLNDYGVCSIFQEGVQ